MNERLYLESVDSYREELKDQVNLTSIEKNVPIKSVMT